MSKHVQLVIAGQWQSQLQVQTVIEFIPNLYFDTLSEVIIKSNMITQG